jgi:hypothetical protein
MMDENTLLSEAYGAAQTLAAELKRCFEAAGNRGGRSRAQEALDAWEDVARAYLTYRQRIEEQEARAAAEYARRERKGRPIVERFAKEQGIELPPAVVAFIAGLHEPRARDIEGAVRRVSASAQFIGKPITLEFAQEALRDLVAPEQKALML